MDTAPQGHGGTGGGWSKQSVKNVNIIVADDEKIVRQSTIRILKKVICDKKLSINLIEVEDGIELISQVIKFNQEEKKIVAIISDETMNFCGGSEANIWLKKLYSGNKILSIPFFIVSAYESSSMGKTTCDGMFSKPLSYNNAENILTKIGF